MEAGALPSVSWATSLTRTIRRAAAGTNRSPIVFGLLRNWSSSRSRTVNCSSPSLNLETSSPPTNVRMLDDSGIERDAEVGGALRGRC